MSFIIKTIFGSTTESSAAPSATTEINEDYFFPQSDPVSPSSSTGSSGPLKFPSEVFIVIHNGKPLQGFFQEEKASEFLSELTQSVIGEKDYKLVNGKAIFIYSHDNQLLHRMTYTGIKIS